MSRAVLPRWQRIWPLFLAVGIGLWLVTAVIIHPIRAQFAIPTSPPFPRSGLGMLINELDADQVGTDAGEFIELYDGGVGQTPLDGLVLVAYNGSNDLTYNLSPFTTAIDLDGYTTDVDGYFIIGNTAVPGVDIVINGNSLQNGQDAVALFLGDGASFPSGTAVTTANLVDALVYDTDDPDDPELLVLLNPGQPQINENGGSNGTLHAMQRCPNGAGGPRNTDTYRLQPPTPGNANNCLPNLTLSKTGPAVIAAGANLTYTISFGNEGVADATAVVLTDTLPTGTIYLADSSGWPCPACTVGAAGILTWSVGTVNTGSSGSFELVTAVTNTLPFGAILTNTATIASPSGDADSTDNNAQWVTAVSPLDLSVSKSGPAVGFSGETLVYTLTLANSGIATATAVILTDTLPLSLTYLADSAPWTAVISGSVITWAAGDVPSDTVTTFHLTATTATSITNGTTLSNTLAASTSAVGDDPTNNTASWPTAFYNIVPIATARAGNDGDLFALAGRVIYTPGTYNSNGWGLQDASGGIAVFYDPPPAVQLGNMVRLAATRGAFNNEEQMAALVLLFQHVAAGPELPPTPFSTGDVLSGSSEGWLTVISGTVSGLDCPTGFNTLFNLDDGSGEATVFVDGDIGLDVCAEGLANGMAATVIGFSTQFGTLYEVKPRRPEDLIFYRDTPDIRKDAPTQVSPGSLFTYTITVANHMGVTLTNVVITDAVPALATFAYAEDNGTFGGGIVTWTLPALANGNSAVARFAVTATQQTAVIENLSYAISAANFATPTQGAPVETLVLSGTLSIHHIQGARHYSMFVDEVVTAVEGIVTAVDGDGFFMQEPQSDDDDATAEGIFVYTAVAPSVLVGDLVSVTGTVAEFSPDGGEGLSITEIEDVVATTLSGGHSLPAPIVLGADGRVPPNQIIDNDSPGDVNLTLTFDPDEDGIDFYESVEGMLVQVNDARVVGSTHFNEIIVVGDNGANGGLFSQRGALVIQTGDFNPERIIIDDDFVSGVPEVQVGDHFTDIITGVMSYSFGNFKLLNLNPLPPLATVPLAAETTTLTQDDDHLTVAAFNVENLDPTDDSEKFEALAGQILHNLQAPDILALVEVQDNNGPADDGTVEADETYDLLIGAIIDAGGPEYAFRDIAPENNQDGGEPGGNIRVGFLFQPERVTFVDRPGGTAVTPVTATLGADGVSLSFSPGRIAPLNNAFLSSRKPLAGEFIFNGHKLIVIANHFNSKGGDDALFGRHQPPIFSSEAQRIHQAEVVNGFVQTILAIDPAANVIVLGDLNDFPFSPPINALESDILHNLVETLPAEEQYSYLFEGNAQVLDHILVSEHLATVAEFDMVHANAEFEIETRATDHDPVVSRFDMPLVTAGFTSNSPVHLGDLSHFTNTAVGALSYAWDFGDGLGVSTAVNPTYLYTAVGTYTVVLTASNSFGSDVVTGTHRVISAGYQLFLPVIVKPPVTQSSAATTPLLPLVMVLPMVGMWLRPWRRR